VKPADKEAFLAARESESRTGQLALAVERVGAVPAGNNGGYLIPWAYFVALG
jgi:hypothetical protein